MKVYPSILVALALIAVVGLAPAGGTPSDKIVAKEIRLVSEDGKVEIVLKAGKDRVDLRVGSTSTTAPNHIAIMAGNGAGYMDFRHESTAKSLRGIDDGGMPHVQVKAGIEGGYVNLIELIKRRR